MINRTTALLRWIANGRFSARRVRIVRRALSMNNLSVSGLLAAGRSPTSQLRGS